MTINGATTDPLSMLRDVLAMHDANLKEIRDAGDFPVPHPITERIRSCIAAAEQDAREYAIAGKDDPPMRIAQFWSSASPGKKVFMLAEGDDIERWSRRSDFIRWCDFSSRASERESELTQALEGINRAIIKGVTDRDGSWFAVRHDAIELARQMLSTSI